MDNFTICFKKILTYLPDQQFIRLQRINKKLFEKVTQNLKSQKVIDSTQNQEQNEYICLFKNQKIFKIKITDILNLSRPQWQNEDLKLFGKNSNIISNKSQTIQISDQKLIVIDPNDNNVMIHLTDNTVDMLPKQKTNRYLFGTGYQKQNQLLWIVGGRNQANGESCKTVKRLDLTNLKWQQFKDTNIEYDYNPGCMFSQDNSYVYVLQNYDAERLKLGDDQANWENVQTDFDFGYTIKTIPHQIQQNQVYIFSSKFLNLMKIGDKLQKVEKVAHCVDIFENVDPIIYDNVLIAIGNKHIHIWNIGLDKCQRRHMCGIGSIFEISAGFSYS